jgi:hypothetical protein
MDGVHTILFDARTATPAYPGISRYIRSLLAAMVPELRAGERLHVICPLTQTSPAGVPEVTTYATGRSRQHLQCHWQAFKLARAIKAQIYHAPTSSPRSGGRARWC